MSGVQCSDCGQMPCICVVPRMLPIEETGSSCLSCGLVPVACVWQSEIGPDGYGCLLNYGQQRQEKAALERQLSTATEALQKIAGGLADAPDSVLVDRPTLTSYMWSFDQKTAAEALKQLEQEQGR